MVTINLDILTPNEHGTSKLAGTAVLEAFFIQNELRVWLAKPNVPPYTINAKFFHETHFYYPCYGTPGKPR